MDAGMVVMEFGPLALQMSLFYQLFNGPVVNCVGSEIDCYLLIALGEFMERVGMEAGVFVVGGSCGVELDMAGANLFGKRFQG